MKRLETPRTLRIPNHDEVPQRKELLDAISRSQSANLFEGYVLTPICRDDLPYKLYAVINIDNSRLWSLFETLALHLPEEISLIFNHADGEAIFGRYQDKHTVINELSRYTLELTQDCFLEFGAIHQTQDFLEEVFVDRTKFVKYWGMDEEWFRATMNEFGIPETPDLSFIDEFPKIMEALRLHFEDTIETVALIEILKNKFI